MILKGYVFALIYASAVLLFAALAHRVGVKKTYTRKLVHILVGFEWFILSFYHENSIHFLVVCLFFLALLFLIYKKGWLSMMSSDGDNAPGTVYYALSMTILSALCIFVPELMKPFGIGVLITSLGDGFGGVFGCAIPRKIHLYKNKTLFGTLAVFAFSFACSLLFSEYYHLPLGARECLSLAFLAAGTELVCSRGLDNLFLPLGTAFFSFLLIYIEPFRDMAIALSLAPLLFAIMVARKRFTVKGALVAALLDLLVAVAFGDRGFALLIVFLALALVSDGVKKLAGREERGECRGASQVLANSILAMIGALSYLIFSHQIFLFIFILVFAEALGDTAASGFGALSKKTFDLFHLCPVEKGASGGISFIGSLGGVLFAFCLAALGGLLFSLRLRVVVAISLCAVFGILLDSALGSLIQLKYECSKCKKTVEIPTHCNTAAIRVRGLYPFDNTFVNLVCSALTVLLFFIVYIFM